MKYYKLKRNCFGRSAGEIVPLEEAKAKAMGADYLEEAGEAIDEPKEVVPDNKVMTTSDVIVKEEKQPEETKTSEPNAEQSAHTNESQEVETNELDTSTEEEAEAIDYESKSYQELKALADERGIEYKHNISKIDLITELKK